MITRNPNRYRCDAGGCLQCPLGTPASACPHTDPNCGAGVGVQPCGGTLPLDGDCNNPNWVSIPLGIASGTYTWWGKRDYCKRCELISTNPTGLAEDGYFPVNLLPNAPYFNPTPNGQNYCKCCKGINQGGDIPPSVNPATSTGFGFSNTYDGRVRGGIKTPEAFRRNTNKMGKEFNIFDKEHRK